ncbi:type II toxin-antitoxin system RelE/ParE family toxin [Rheinheimera hassiensis]|uniref:type II toxin-antitoxin system RelE/ParE family toxin n=1 Tax=Rheinheimera hassiensis TaxID=1193627 RepID=UPI001F0547FC|nr:type II toxin-antitoxin system RelE/ParE family toxin [Rheinheimera hassiensis]
MAQYRLSHSADQDFFDIYIYGAQTFGVKQAEAYTAGMQLRFQEIADTPHLYQAVDSIRPGYRRSVFGVHAIYYRQDSEDVLIVRILRAQNLPTALAEDIS